MTLEEFLEKYVPSADLVPAMSALQEIIEDEKQKFSDRLASLEEQTQVTRAEFDELKKRIERLEQTQRSITEVIIRI